MELQHGNWGLDSDVYANIGLRVTMLAAVVQKNVGPSVGPAKIIEVVKVQGLGHFCDPVLEKRSQAPREVCRDRGHKRDIGVLLRPCKLSRLILINT